MTDPRRFVDQLDIVSAIWILASNDENPLISYRGLVYRLGLSNEKEARAIIAARPELFRHGATQKRVDEWKARMRTNKSIPVWIKDLPTQTERLDAIEQITPKDVFRSQFRTEPGAERSPIEIIRWGLDHLERLRQAKSQADDAVAKKWQMWLVFCVGVAGLVLQCIFAFYKGNQ